jgi:hypothetical protein
MDSCEKFANSSVDSPLRAWSEIVSRRALAAGELCGSVTISPPAASAKNLKSVPRQIASTMCICSTIFDCLISGTGRNLLIANHIRKRKNDHRGHGEHREVKKRRRENLWKSGSFSLHGFICSVSSVCSVVNRCFSTTTFASGVFDDLQVKQSK